MCVKDWRNKALALKKRLMILSLSPLALLTIIRNFSFDMPPDNAEKYIQSFVAQNKVLLVVFILCSVWILMAAFSFISLLAFKWTDKHSGYDIKNVNEIEDASLNFFMTMIIPLLIDDVGSIQGAITFFIIVIMMRALLEKTSLFYANPVLAILDYRVYSFSFQENEDYKDGEYIGISYKRISKCATIEYKEISDGVFYIKEL